MKKRIDLLIVEKKISETRNKAQMLVSSGQILINGKKISKNSSKYQSNINITIDDSSRQWVSRGALKLLHAINHFDIDLRNKVCLDLGASTGGFTEVLLSRGAKKIYAVDVGTNQMHKKLLTNKRVINISQINARYLDKNIINQKIEMIVCDVSFISLKKVIKPSLLFLDKKFGIIIALIKPQFELNKREIGKNGIISDHKIHQRICNDYKKWFEIDCNMKVIGIIPSPIKVSKGNIEFLIYAKRNT